MQIAASYDAAIFFVRMLNVCAVKLGIVIENVYLCS